MAKFLSQDQINEYKECFSLYDKQQRGKIKATDLLVAMRCLGASPTPGEAEQHLQTHRIDRNGELDFSTFLTIMHTQIKQEDPRREILLAMLMADKEKKGYIMASELQSKLMSLGEKLTQKEVAWLETRLYPLILQAQSQLSTPAAHKATGTGFKNSEGSAAGGSSPPLSGAGSYGSSFMGSGKHGLSSPFGLRGHCSRCISGRAFQRSRY
ncbi:PREDICTED: calmodulin-like protein 4 isoform X1 [Chinchilla lanigera]|uniref:calmodulin-like protein 4 isoform X1 n=1 Tax=Chinchilla lanigera TaxID=34839 RepID=UPI0006982123|nr:PREDICTED: calmodulin-like protein 4 isoform X1 [Chinchilla lanigera]XP_013374356.1 PREDICTED: calmodulin-like protein 4 isoform X1 [Chinchilla lanigera]XP_013374357.1 PREDICTED: calmodulin-like protein 4 isoform X1 [Chinchilla lanigera]